MRVALHHLVWVLVAAGCDGAQAAPDAGDDAASAADVASDGTLIGDANVPDDGAAPVDAGCGAGIVTELSATSGAVVSGTIAHAGNGNALAVWMQYDDGDGGKSGAWYAAEHQGCAWGAPVQLEKIGDLSIAAPHPPQVAANDATFVLLHWLGGLMPPQVWTGSGLTNATGTFTNGVLGSDGTTFVDVTFTGQGYSSTTSTDGLAWTTSQPAETIGTFDDVLATGPAGVMAWSYDAATKEERARVWQKGAWSAPALLPSNGYGVCQGAVGSTTALIACIGPTPGDGGPTYVDVQLFDGTWHDLPPPQVSIPVLVLVATDGTDYRVEYGSPPVGAILHNGVWTAVSDATMAHGTAGRSGAWTSMRIDVQTGYLVSRASGLAGFPAPTSLVPEPILVNTWIGLAGAPFSGWPGRTDVAFVDRSGDGGVNTFYVALDL